MDWLWKSGYDDVICELLLYWCDVAIYDVIYSKRPWVLVLLIYCKQFVHGMDPIRWYPNKFFIAVFSTRFELLLISIRTHPPIIPNHTIYYMIMKKTVIDIDLSIFGQNSLKWSINYLIRSVVRVYIQVYFGINMHSNRCLKCSTFLIGAFLWVRVKVVEVSLLNSMHFVLFIFTVVSHCSHLIKS